MSITPARSGGGVGIELTSDSNFAASLRKYFEINRIFSVALVYCDKMCAIPSLGAKEEIKKQRIKFSDSELDLANTQVKQIDDHSLCGIL